jgi:hypothetical protein
MEWSDIVLVLIGLAIGYGPAALKIVKLKGLVVGAAKYLDGLSDPNPQIRQDAIAKGISEVATIIDKYIPKK